MAELLIANWLLHCKLDNSVLVVLRRNHQLLVTLPRFGMSNQGDHDDAEGLRSLKKVYRSEIYTPEELILHFSFRIHFTDFIRLLSIMSSTTGNKGTLNTSDDLLICRACGTQYDVQNRDELKSCRICDVRHRRSKQHWSLACDFLCFITDICLRIHGNMSHHLASHSLLWRSSEMILMAITLISSRSKMRRSGRLQLNRRWDRLGYFRFGWCWDKTDDRWLRWVLAKEASSFKHLTAT